MFTNIIVGILAFLLTLFPNWGSLQYNYLMQTNAPKIAAPKIMDAVLAKDIAALESMMCKDIKDNVPDLRTEISKMLDLVDGAITGSRWTAFSGSYVISDGLGKTENQGSIDIYITTTVGYYCLGMVWETANSFAMEETGIRNIALVEILPIEDPAQKYVRLAMITAPGGVRLL